MKEEKEVCFATSNNVKFMELQNAIKESGIKLVKTDLEVDEIQADSIVEIVQDKAKKYFALLHKPVICTDGGIFIDSLNGFPGIYSKMAATMLGAKGILKLLDGEENRKAWRRCATTYYDGKEFKTLISEIECKISTKIIEPLYESYELDKILVPVDKLNPEGLTYGEIRVEDRKNFIELPSPVDFLKNVIV